jgi:hypothetical protein
MAKQEQADTFAIIQIAIQARRHKSVYRMFNEVGETHVIYFDGRLGREKEEYCV